MATRKELQEKFGYISASEHPDRVQIQGLDRVGGSPPTVEVMSDEGGILYLVICLDPSSPFGEILERYCIPFVPTPDFHLDNAKLKIYASDDNKVRMDVIVSTKRLFGEESEEQINLIYACETECGNVYR